jgi:hypothetical protein
MGRPFVGEPGLRLTFGDDGEDFDRFFPDVIEHSQVVDAQPILRPDQAVQSLDPAPAQLRGFVSQMSLECVPDRSAQLGAESLQRFGGRWGEDDLMAHLARI